MPGLVGEALTSFRALGDQWGIAAALSTRAKLAMIRGDPATVHRDAQQSLELFRELGDRWGIGGPLADLGNLAREQGDYSTACSLYRESIKIFQELDHKRGIARLLECFAAVAADQLEAERLSLRKASATERYSSDAPSR